MQKLEKQLADKHITLEVSERALDAIAEEGFDPIYGARPLKRVIQRRLQNKIATELLRREQDDNSPIHIDCEDSELVLNSKQ
jgi:ATP-dependent Clp protease ATP-binding subunit ClpB